MVSRDIVTKPSGGGAPCPTDPDAYLHIEDCNTFSCHECEYETWDAFFEREGASAVWSSCSGCDGEQTIGPRRVVKEAPLGGFCDPKEAYLSRTCCKSCNCEYCPIGCDGEVCSNHGTCTLQNSTQSGGVIVTTGTCECTAPWQGDSCGLLCPQGPGGQVCSGPDRGTCKSDGTCDCREGLSGVSCAVGGSCLITYGNEAIGLPDTDLCAPLDDKFTYVHCQMLPALLESFRQQRAAQQQRDQSLPVGYISRSRVMPTGCSSDATPCTQKLPMCEETVLSSFQKLIRAAIDQQPAYMADIYQDDAVPSTLLDTSGGATCNALVQPPWGILNYCDMCVESCDYI